VRWAASHRADPSAREIADRHYNRQKVGAKQFAPPGRCSVYVIPREAFWITSWPFAEYVKHAWAGAWVCSAFRNERPDLHRSSEMIREALAATRSVWPDPPSLGMITFVDRDKTKPKKDPGYCYLKAGFHVSGTRPCCADKPSETVGGLVALHLAPTDMPGPCEPLPKGFYEFIRDLK
jgi:hypothetical protein